MNVEIIGDGTQTILYLTLNKEYTIIVNQHIEDIEINRNLIICYFYFFECFETQEGSLMEGLISYVSNNELPFNTMSEYKRTYSLVAYTYNLLYNNNRKKEIVISASALEENIQIVWQNQNKELERYLLDVSNVDLACTELEVLVEEIQRYIPNISKIRLSNKMLEFPKCTTTGDILDKRRDIDESMYCTYCKSIVSRTTIDYLQSTTCSSCNTTLVQLPKDKKDSWIEFYNSKNNYG